MQKHLIIPEIIKTNNPSKPPFFVTLSLTNLAGFISSKYIFWFSFTNFYFSIGSYFFISIKRNIYYSKNLER